LIFLAGKSANLAWRIENLPGTVKISVKNRPARPGSPISWPKRVATWPTRLKTWSTRPRLAQNGAELSEPGALLA